MSNKALDGNCRTTATSTLSKEQALALQEGHKVRSLSQQSTSFNESLLSRGGGGRHGHHEKAPSILTAVASAVINYLLMFGLCCAYGMIMFEDDWNKRHRGLGVNMNLASAFLMGLLLSSTSKIGVAIGGPDLNPVVFLGMFVSTIAESLAAQHGLMLPTASRRLLESCSEAMQTLDPVEFLRRLAEASSGGSDFCTGGHYTANAAACDAYHAELRATTIFTVAVSSALLGLLLFCLGRFRLTRFVSYVPTNIMEAFLSCVGYKVFKYALKFCKYEPQQFIPAAVIGVPLYFMKAMHLGNPAVVIPLALLTPLGIFYAAVYGSGSDLETVRDQKWMFPPIEDADFRMIWAESVGSPWNINFQAWAATLPELPIMVIVCLLDCMLKLSSTESKLPVKVDKDYEAQLFGVGNAAIALCGSSVGYMQLKFNVINFGVVGNVKDRRGGVIYALLCGACYFWTTDLFNYLPRFFLSTLLFFAGAGFVAENLWGSREYLTIAEWLQIFVILAVFILFNSLLYAVIVGGLITGVTFIFRYARIPCMLGQPRTGAEVCSLERCSLPLTRTIQHIADSWVVVIRLKGFIFFASAEAVTDWMKKHFEKRCAEEVPKHRWPKWILMDCDQLDGLDCSASKSFGRMVADLKEYGVQVCWSGLAPELKKQLSTCSVITRSSHSFRSQLEATQYFERSICRYAGKQQEKWVMLHPLFSLAHQMMKERMAFEPFEDIFKADAARLGCPWKYCGRVRIEANSTVLWRPGETNRDLFLVHTGSVGLLASISGSGQEGGRDPAVLQVCRRGRFLNHGALLGAPTSLHAVALEDGELLCWNRAQWARMKREQPYMASAILEAVLEQKHAECEHADRVTGSAVFQGRDPALPASTEDATETAAPWGKGMAAAEALGSLGLFDPAGDTSAPLSAIPVPRHLEAELRAAFRTYCRSKVDGKHSLPMDKAGDALMYAGIFGAAESVEVAESLALEEFVVLGGRLAMMQLGSHARERLQGMFAQFEAGCSGCMDHTDLATFVQEKVHGGISADEVAGLASMFSNSSAGRPNAAAFLAVMSRLARKHEVHWFMLLGARDLIGCMEGGGEGLTPKMLVNNGGNLTLTQEEAEELIWAANIAGEANASLDIRLLPLVLAPIHVPVLELPPEPSKADDAAPCTATSSLQSPLLKRMHTDFQSLPMEKRIGLAPRLGAHNMPSAATDDDLMILQESEEQERPPTCRAKLYLFLDEPQSSRMASWWSVLMGMMILVSIFTLFLEPLVHPRAKPRSKTADTIWYTFEIFFTMLFSVELLARFLVANALGTQTLTGFLIRPMNICDFLSVLPLYINWIVDDSKEEFRLFRLVRFLRLARLVKLGRLAAVSQTFAPIAMILIVIWGIFLQSGLEMKG